MSAEYIIFMDSFTVEVGKITGSDFKVGTLLLRNRVCNREIYDFVVYLLYFHTITKGILASKNMRNRCVVYAFPPVPTLTSLPVTT